jgi:hypothetical protein
MAAASEFVGAIAITSLVSGAMLMTMCGGRVSDS